MTATQIQLKQKVEKLKEQIEILTTLSLSMAAKAEEILAIDPELAFVSKRLHKAAKHISISALNCELKVNKYAKQIASNTAQ